MVILKTLCRKRLLWGEFYVDGRILLEQVLQKEVAKTQIEPNLLRIGRFVKVIMKIYGIYSRVPAAPATL
jgi:hypothetical protein